MNKRLKVTIILFTFCIILLNGCLNQNDKNSSDNSKGNNSGLLFTINLDKEEYLIGEPIIITASIKNNYNKTINIGEFKLETDTLDFEIITPNNISLNYFGPTIYFVGKIQLQPNATIQEKYNLLNENFGYENLDKYNFTLLGNYSIQGFYQSFATTETVMNINLESNKEYFIIKDIKSI